MWFRNNQLKLCFVASISLILLGFLLKPAKAAVYDCQTVAEASTRLEQARPGDTILLADGEYALGSLTISSNGSLEQPITFKAKNTGKVVFNDAAKLYIEGKYVVIDGFKFTGKGSYLEFTKATTGSSMLNVIMDGCGDDTWVAIWGTYCRVGYCVFANKTGSPQRNRELLRLRAGVEHHARIDHNLFYNYRFISPDPYQPVPNGSEAIQVGMYLEKLPGNKIPWKNVPTDSVIEHNYFYKWYGETEIVSVKASRTIFRYNTVSDCWGTITLRQADDCEVYGNFFLQQQHLLEGGLRVYGARHKIYNNYFSTAGESPIRTGIALQSGNSDPELDPQPAGDILIAFNTFVNCKKRSITIGTDYPVSPSGCVIANNVIQSDNGILIGYDKAPAGFTYEGNIAFGTELGIDQPKGITIIDPLLTVAPDGLYRPSAKSPLINNAKGDYDFITDDLDGELRSGKKDIGADESGSGQPARFPLSITAVGPRTASGAALLTKLPETLVIAPLAPQATASTNYISASVTSKIKYPAGSYDLEGENTGTRTVEFDLVPLENKIDGLVGYAGKNVNITAATLMSVIIRMNPNGYFDVRDGGDFRAAAELPYTANNKYHVKAKIDLNSKTYSVWVTPLGSKAILLAENYKFRSDAPPINDLGKICVRSKTADNQFMMENHKIE